MNVTTSHILFLLLFVIPNLILAEIDFVRDVKPVLEHNCVSCHREGNDKGNVRLDTKEVFLVVTM